jgi:hypothetical protein
LHQRLAPAIELQYFFLCVTKTCTVRIDRSFFPLLAILPVKMYRFCLNRSSFLINVILYCSPSVCKYTVEWKVNQLKNPGYKTKTTNKHGFETEVCKVNRLITSKDLFKI